jgi:hypothetical protein
MKIKPDKSNLEKIATLNKVFIGAVGSCANNYLHGLLNSHPEIISIPFQYRPINILLKCKSHSKEKLIEEVIEGFLPMFNKEKTNKHGNFSGFEISQETFREVLENEVSMAGLTHHKLTNLINYAYVKAVNQDISEAKIILIHFHDLSEEQALKLTLIDYPDAKWIIPIRHPLAYMHSDVECYNNKSRTLSMYLHANYQKLEQTNFEYLKLMEKRATYIKLEDMTKDLHSTMQKLSVFLGVSFTETMLKSTFGGNEYSSTTENNQNIRRRPKTFSDTKFKEDFSYQDIRFLETTFRQFMKRFDFEFGTDANMSREELLSHAMQKMPGFFKLMKTHPTVTHKVMFKFKEKYFIFRALDKIGLGRVSLTLALFIMRGLSPTSYFSTERISDSENTIIRTKVIDKNIKFNSISWTDH